MMTSGLPTPWRDLPQGSNLPAAPRCTCGKRISANKRFCWDCAISEAIKAGVITDATVADGTALISEFVK